MSDVMEFYVLTNQALTKVALDTLCNIVHIVHMKEHKAAVTGEGNAPHKVRIIWSTPSGTGSTEFTYLCKDYSEALAKAREEFRVFFSGYTLTATSIA